MKKILITLSAIAFSGSVFSAATNVCTGGDSTSVTVNAATSALFIKQSFSQKCSANVYLAYDESATVVTVGAASKKGKNNFTGTSAGGSVAANGTVCANGCTAAPTPPSPGGAS